jgi:hypothetical protein
LVAYQAAVRATLPPAAQARLKAPLQLKVKKFSSKDYLKDYIESSTYASGINNGICMGIVIDALPDNKGYNIDIMMNDQLPDR